VQDSAKVTIEHEYEVYRMELFPRILTDPWPEFQVHDTSHSGEYLKNT